MFFKRLSRDKAAAKPLEATDVAKRVDGAAPADAAAKSGNTKPLASTELRRTIDGKALGFKTTADITCEDHAAGQARAIKALDFGLAMKARDFNIFVVGPPSSGKRTLVHRHLAKVAAASETPSDWVYVSSFSEARGARAISLPPGRAKALSEGMLAAVREIAAALPAALQAEDYLARRRAIDEDFHADQEDAVQGVHIRAAQQNIAVLRTPLGFTMAPMHDGKVVKPEVFSQLPERMRRDVETRVATLQSELEAVLSQAPQADKARRRQLAELDQEIIGLVAEDALDALSAAFADVPDVAGFIADAHADMVARSHLLSASANGSGFSSADVSPGGRFRRYLVNTIVSHDDAKGGAPVVDATGIRLHKLSGQMTAAGDGTDCDALAIEPGLLHLANGGAIMIDARSLAASPDAWRDLKRALAAGEIASDGSAAPSRYSPEPIPLQVKAVLLGDAETLRTLEQSDPDFARLFKVQAEMDETLARGKDNDATFTQLVAGIVEAHALKPIDAAGVARVMEEAQRLAEDREKLSLDMGRLADLLREADYWSDHAKRKTTTAGDVTRAVEEKTRRNDRARGDLKEALERGIVLLDTAGAKTGQVNALSLVQKGNLSFGRPARISARVHLGSGRVTDIEREVQLGGPLHSKGVMILWGYLAGRFAPDVPLSLAASLVFEQSYEAIEGDSAAAAELFALLSALAEAPLRQDLGVTGSINQWGEVQAVGAINEKIEGFFDACSARGLTGTQGVIIPDANRQHLMLREDVVEAVRAERFSVYAIRSVDEGMALLTGLEAGADGRFGADTLNGRVDQRLRAFADKARWHAGTKDLPRAGAAA